MNDDGRSFWKRLGALLVAPQLDPSQQAWRVLTLQRDIAIPIKLILIVTLGYFLFFARWIYEPGSARGDAVAVIRWIFLGYSVVTISVGILFWSIRRMPLHVLEWVVFGLGLLDGLLLAGLIIVTGGFESILFWLFLGIILGNALSIPRGTLQIALNLAVGFCYVIAGLIDVAIVSEETATLALDRSSRQTLELAYAENPAEPFALRVFVLVLWTACCYGIQALIYKQKQAEEEAHEFLLRQEQLQAAGRLAAEIAHQIKNPLGIINNAAFTMQRALQDQKNSCHEQLNIIREEVERADRIITELMGYARLSEGRVEKLNIAQELDHAIEQVFPPGAKYNISIKRNYAPALPSVLMHRAHLSEVLINLLQNAREAMQGRGIIEVTASYGQNYAIIVTIADTGPGIPPDRLEQIFEPYFTTKEKGTGLGLAIVKHNVDLYGGKLRVDSKLGNGTTFILEFPGKTFLRLSA
jgi:signal transduction histidine kinase